MTQLQDYTEGHIVQIGLVAVVRLQHDRLTVSLDSSTKWLNFCRISRLFRSASMSSCNANCCFSLLSLSVSSLSLWSITILSAAL